MRTLHLTNAWHATSGGIATFYRALLGAANDRQHHVRLVVPAATTEVEDVGRYGRIYHLEAPPAPLNRHYRVLMSHRYLWPGTAIHNILARERPELVEICDKYTLNLLAGLLRMRWIPRLEIRPTIVALSCERMDDNVAAYVTRRSLGKLFSRFYMKWCYFPLFDHHITISEYTADELRLAARGHRVGRGVWVRPMGVDLEGFSPGRQSAGFRRRLLAELGGREDSVILLYAGRLVPEKNLPLLVGMLAELARDTRRDYRLLVVGDGILAEQVRAQCERVAPGRATFRGHIDSRQSLARFYANADVFIHPNPREPFGIAPLEAMASGLPLVAPDSGGLTTYATPRNSWVTDPTPQSFSAAVRAAVTDHVDRLQRTSEALRTAAFFDWPSVAHRYLRLYEAIHALAAGREVEESLTPQFFSTRGNWFGIEG
jgi:alpha-1,6-mannosyltransferase